MPASGRHLPSLTALRLFAALAVLMYHLHLYFPPIAGGLAFFGYGFTGVSFFFILSGFVLTWAHREGTSSRRFYWHRVARIWPLHLLTSALAVFAPPLMPAAESNWVSAPFVATLTQAWIPASPFLGSYNGVSWSLSCEAFFYLAFPFLLHRMVLASRVRRVIFVVVPLLMLVLALGLAAISSVSAADFLLGTMPLYRLGEFVLGISLARLMQQGWIPGFSIRQAAYLLLALYFCLVGASLVAHRAVPVTFANLLLVPAFLAIIAACSHADLSGRTRLLGSPALVRLGQWSFALYLVHELVLRVAKPYATSPGKAILLAAAVVLASVILSGLLHEFVEKPSEGWLRRRGTVQTGRQVQHP